MLNIPSLLFTVFVMFFCSNLRTPISTPVRFPLTHFPIHPSADPLLLSNVPCSVAPPAFLALPPAQAYNMFPGACSTHSRCPYMTHTIYFHTKLLFSYYTCSTIAALCNNGTHITHMCAQRRATPDLEDNHTYPKRCY